MSHTPILVFCLRSRPLLPLGGGNVAALQHEGRVGSVRPGRSFEAKERCSQKPLGSHRWCSRTSEVERRRRRRGGLEGQRDSLHCHCCAEAAREWAEVPGQARAEAAVLSARSEGPQGLWQQPSRDSRAPGGRPRDQGGDPAPQAGADPTRRYPREARATGSAGSWFLDAGAPGCRSAHGPLPFRVAPGRVASQGRQPQIPEDEEVGEGDWPGG